MALYENNYMLDACLEARNFRRIRHMSKNNNDAILMYAFTLMIYCLHELVKRFFEESQLL